ncbi:MAG: autotransporter-associated beta strand repeat-containing protein, partial [Candidatus Omnitrophica bacterium]|nr:autotransporter-associated beta strand repeat-containing protein [Candidatus Omnitrophota bacterium]
MKEALKHGLSGRPTLRRPFLSLLYLAIFILFVFFSFNLAFAGVVTVDQGTTVNWGNSSDAPNYTGASTGTYQTMLTGQDIAGPVTFVSTGSIGTLSLAGSSAIAGAIGDSDSSLGALNINGASSLVSLGGDSYITTTNFANTATGATLSLAPGITFNGNITTTTPGNGILVFQTTAGTAATVNGNIGSLGNALAEVDVYQSSGCLIDGDVVATDFAFKGNGGNVSIAAGHSITTTNAITVASNGASTITYLGTTTIGKDLGSAAGNKFAYINFNGGTVTLGANLYTSTSSYADAATTVNNATLNLTDDRTIGGKLTLKGGGSITGAGQELTVNSGGSFDMQSGTISAILTGAVALNKTTAGTVTLTGANTYTGATAVNQGILDLNGGSIGNTSSVSIGSADGDGTLQLDSSSSSVSTAGDITIGNSTGDGTLTTSGSVSARNIYLGNDSSNYGTMTIYSGTTVTDTSGYIGYSTGALTNTVNVNGSNAKWTNSANIYVGYSGTGTLAISNGGAVTNVSGSVATNS